MITRLFHVSRVFLCEYHCSGPNINSTSAMYGMCHSLDCAPFEALGRDSGSIDCIIPRAAMVGSICDNQDPFKWDLLSLVPIHRFHSASPSLVKPQPLLTKSSPFLQFLRPQLLNPITCLHNPQRVSQNAQSPQIWPGN